MSKPDNDGLIDRRSVLKGGASAALLLAARPAASSVQPSTMPAPIEAVRLLPSPYLSAVQANLSYLYRLEPDRLLHNFRSQAGLGFLRMHNEDPTRTTLFAGDLLG